MGMFDHITCNYPLPEPESELRDDFQTKDLYNSLDTYTITESGRLIRYCFEWEEVPEDERPYPKDHKLSFIGSVREKQGSGKDVDTNYHGWLNFYGKAGEYNAKFTDGKIVEIVKVKQ